MRRGSYLTVVAALLFGTMAAPAQAETIQITMTNLVIAPSEVSAKVGDTIEWINKDILAHTATVNGEWNVVIAPKKTEKQVVQKAGTFDYYCKYHPNMKGRLVVEP